MAEIECVSLSPPQPLELICEKAIATSNRPLGPGEALRRFMECVASGILLPGQCSVFPSNLPVVMTTMMHKNLFIHMLLLLLILLRLPPCVVLSPQLIWMYFCNSMITTQAFTKDGFKEVLSSNLFGKKGFLFLLALKYIGKSMRKFSDTEKMAVTLESVTELHREQLLGWIYIEMVTVSMVLSL